MLSSVYRMRPEADFDHSKSSVGRAHGSNLLINYRVPVEDDSCQRAISLSVTGNKVKW